MAEGKNPTPDINLLPGDDLENKAGGKFLKWALSWGKRIVVFTELIVILAFLSRFWLDTTVANNNDKITQKKNVVVASSNFEANFRKIADKVSKAQSLENSVSALTVYDEAKKLIPLGIDLNQLSVNGDKVSFTGTADEPTLAKLIDAFKNSASFGDVSVERIARKGVVITDSFALSATYAKPK